MLPITHKILIDWAGPSVFRDGQTLYEKGYVLEAAYEPPLVRGLIQWGNRPFKSSFTIMPDGMVENHCPCRDSTERGIICAHVIALGLDLIKRASDPLREVRRREELRKAARSNVSNDANYIRRVPADSPDAYPAKLRITLANGWKEGAGQGRIPILCEAEYDGRREKLEVVPRDVPLTFSKTDEAVLFVLEDIAEGPAPGQLELGMADFVNLIHLHVGRALFQEDGPEALVGAAKLPSFLRMDLDRERGELILMLHTELPFARPGEIPLYLVFGHSGWVFGADHFWRLENVLPEPLRSIYTEPITVNRPAVPRFLKVELPALAQHIRIETDISSDLFAIEPADPQFRLGVKGSPASLAATLFAHYDGAMFVAGKPDPKSDFAIPDPTDILRYTVRNPEAEARGLKRLASFGFSGAVGDALSRIVGFRDVMKFLGSAMPALRRMGWDVGLEGRVGPYMESLSFATPVVHVTDTADHDWFEVGFGFEDGQGQSLAEAEIQRALRKGDCHLEKDGRTLLLDAGAINAMMEVFRDCASREGSAPGTFRMASVFAAYVKESLDALDGIDVEATPGWRERAEAYTRSQRTGTAPLPAELLNVLRSYQVEGVNWLRFLEANGFCGILADEMGLGKTLQTLAWLQMQRSHPGAEGKPALVICPTSLVDNWIEEAFRFVPHMKALAVTGADRHSKWEELAQADLIVTSYALMRRDLDQYLKHEFSVVVLDEAQHIKNRSTQNAIAAKQLRGFNRLVLTGTPIENSVSDLWSIMDFLMPDYLGSHMAFRTNYENPIAQDGMEGEAAHAKLRRKLRPFLLRRMKMDVAKELPAKIERVASCALTADQAAVYAEYLENSRRRLTDMVARFGFERSRMEVLKTLLRLRQVCCHLDLLKLPDLHSKHPSAKMDLFFELLDEALDGGHRLLVFSQFVSMLTILRQELEQRELTYCYLDGSTKDRLQIVREFNTNRAIPVFLISLKAGGTGLNLTGADMVIHFDPWWNPAVEDQATDRAHRIGQKRTVYGIKMITRGTVEEKVLALQKKKKALINATILSDRDVAKGFTWEEIKEILA